MSTERDTILEVQGMTCPSCIRHVTAALNEVDGVEKVDVKLRDGLVVVQHDPNAAPIDRRAPTTSCACWRTRVGSGVGSGLNFGTVTARCSVSRVIVTVADQGS